MPRISVIVPVYQAEALLPACLDSVLQQSFSDWELLLIDDGSRDASPAICDRYAEGDPRIRVFHKENGGVSEARNLGLKNAVGEYIAFLDADDRFEPQTLAVLLELCEKNGADTAGCAHWNLLPDGTKTPEQLLPAGVYDREAMRERIVCPLLGDRLRIPVFNGFIWRYLFSASVLRQAGITFEGAYLEDDIFLMEYFSNANRLAVTEEPLYYYYFNPNSATRRYMKDFLQVFRRVMERKEKLVEKYGLNAARPLWRENTNWAGILIAVGNEYAAGNPKSMKERRAYLKWLCAEPEMKMAIETITPTGMSGNKQVVARLVKGKHFTLLTLLYRMKNRI